MLVCFTMAFFGVLVAVAAVFVGITVAKTMFGSNQKGGK